MTTKGLANFFKTYKKSSAKSRKNYLRAFEGKMIYRTTKTENPTTTKKMVRQVLEKLK